MANDSAVSFYKPQMLLRLVDRKMATQSFFGELVQSREVDAPAQSYPHGYLRQRLLSIFCLSCVLATACFGVRNAVAADCLKFSQQGKLLVLKGKVCPGDDLRFATFLKSTVLVAHTVKLQSGGGNGPAALAIGKVIRQRGFDTFVDASSDKCASACTHIFAAGVRRYYPGSSTIVTGLSAKRGLGYHLLDCRHHETDAVRVRKFKAMIVPYLKEMLPPAAANEDIKLELADRICKVTWLNGDQALRVGIATDLTPPLLK